MYSNTHNNNKMNDVHPIQFTWNKVNTADLSSVSSCPLKPINDYVTTYILVQVKILL